MQHENEKAIKKALKDAVNPLLIGLRNELKNVAKELHDAQTGTGVIFTKGTMEEFADLKRAITPVKGVDYFDGVTPVKGTDYFTLEEQKEFLSSVTPKKGKDYFTAAEKLAFKKAVKPKKGRDYFDGETPVKGKDYFTDAEVSDFLSRVTPQKGIHYRDGKDGAPGKKGADGTQISAEDIRNKLESLRGTARLKISAIKGLEEWLERISLKDQSSPYAVGGSEEGGQGGGGATTWGLITGTLSDQSDLQAALDAKVTKNVSITGATKTKITYDAKGLVTGGADATTTDIAEGTNLYYTAARFNTAFAAKSTTDLSEGSNLYFTTARVLATALSGLSVTGSTIGASDTVLQAFGKLQNQINALVGGVNYQGTWNASTNSPSLSSGSGTKGYYYVVSVAGSTNLDGITSWALGDWAIFNGTAWQKVDNTDAVVSVNGGTGAVTVTVTGTSNRISVSGGTGLTPTIDISASYVGQTSITTLGTIATGVWQGTTVAVSYGGTGATTLTGILKGNGTSAFTAVTAPSGALVGDTDSQTLTNKTLGDAVNSITSPGTTTVGYLGIPQNSQSAAYTAVMADSGKHIFHPSSDANARTFTIPANASVAYPIGTTLTFVNETSQNVTIAITSDTLTLANSTTTGSRTPAQNGIATALKVASTKWIISGVGLT